MIAETGQNTLLKQIFEFSNPLVGVSIHFPVTKFQNTFLVNFQKIYLISKADFEN